MTNPLKRKAVVVGIDNNEVSEHPKKGKRKDYYGDNFSYHVSFFMNRPS